MIPMVFHFSFYRGADNYKWRDIHTLCLRSCLKNAGAQRIVIHYDREDDGPLWEEARALGGPIEWRKTEFPTNIATHRFRTLWEEGGWYADLDFVFIKSFDDLRDNKAVIGTLCKQKRRLASGLMGAVPGAAFIKAYLDCDPSPTANTVPWSLAFTHEATVVPRTVFYPVAMSNKLFWDGGYVSLRNARAVCRWGALKPSLGVEDLKKTILMKQVEAVLRDEPLSVAQRVQGTTLVWE